MNDIPQLVRGELAEAVKTAALTATSTRIEALNQRLQPDLAEHAQSAEELVDDLPGDSVNGIDNGEGDAAEAVDHDAESDESNEAGEAEQSKAVNPKRGSQRSKSAPKKRSAARSGRTSATSSRARRTSSGANTSGTRAPRSEEFGGENDGNYGGGNCNARPLTRGQSWSRRSSK